MKPYEIKTGGALEILKGMADESVNCIVTSPPYWGQRDYGVEGQVGLEGDPEEYIWNLIAIFEEARRVLRKDGTCFVNLGDTYGGPAWVRERTVKTVEPKQHGARRSSGMNKCLLQIPSRFALAMVSRGWILRNEIIWQKPNAMPSSAKDRFTMDYEKVFFFVKSRKYHFSQQFEPLSPATLKDKRLWKKDFTEQRRRRDYPGNPQQGSGMLKPGKSGRNKRSVWSVATVPYPGAHFATFPPKLIEPAIRSGCPDGGVVLDPFSGVATTGLVSLRNGRHFVGIELNPQWVEDSIKRLGDAGITVPLQMAP